MQDLRLADETAWMRLYDQYRDYVYGYHLRRCRDAEDAADLTSETFTRALAARASIREDAFLARAWLTGFARVINAEHRRRRGNAISAIRTLQAQPVAEAGESDPAQILADEWQAAHDAELLAAAWATLCAADQDVVRLAVVDQMTSRQIASTLDIEPAAVRKRLQRAIGRLRRNAIEAVI